MLLDTTEGGANHISSENGLIQNVHQHILNSPTVTTWVLLEQGFVSKWKSLLKRSLCI